MFDWSSAVSRVIEKSLKNGSTDRLDVLDFIVSEKTISVSNLNERCGGGVQRDNRFISPVTKWVHGSQKRASPDNWLPFDPETGTYTVHSGFAQAWKQARG
jgi:hypothetical protein